MTQSHERSSPASQDSLPLVEATGIGPYYNHFSNPSNQPGPKSLAVAEDANPTTTCISNLRKCVTKINYATKFYDITPYYINHSRPAHVTWQYDHSNWSMRTSLYTSKRSRDKEF